MKRETKELLVGVAAVVVFMAIFAAVSSAVLSVGQTGREQFRPTKVFVHEGETAWEIAQRFCPSEVDVREYLGWCAEENGIDSMGNIIAGKSYVFLQKNIDK